MVALQHSRAHSQPYPDQVQSHFVVMPRGHNQSLVANLAQTKCPKAGKKGIPNKAKITRENHLHVIKKHILISHYPCSWEAFIAVVLLCLWSTEVHPQYHLVELFSGAGRVGEVWRPILKKLILISACTFLCICWILNIYACRVRENGLNVGQYDWDYNPQGMNFLSNGGFAFAT